MRRIRPLEKRKLRNEEFNRLIENNKEGKEIQFVTTIDGKEYDYSKPYTVSEDDFYLFGDIHFLRRSNEIKELMKKDHSEVFGIVVNEKEIRYCDVDRYDKKFDLVQLTKKKYHNSCIKEDYVVNHPTEDVRAQSVISGYFNKQYDLGYECYDDYLDYRYSFSTLSFMEGDRNLTPLECGLDGCIFKCGSEKQLKSHRELHDQSLPFPCLHPECKHQCNTRSELKNHMIQHCKTIFPCLQENCRFVSTSQLCDNVHYQSHRSTFVNREITKKWRSLCNICQKIVRYYKCHKKIHPEFCFTCQYPGCKKMYTQIHKFESHRIHHYLRDLNKKH